MVQFQTKMLGLLLALQVIVCFISIVRILEPALIYVK